MKRLLFAIALGALAVSAKAQTLSNVTNIRFSITLSDGSTDNINMTPSAREVEGFLLQRAKDILVAEQATNSPPTVQQSIRNVANSMLLNPLAEQARSNDQKTNKVNLFWAYGSTFWDSVFTGAQRQSIKDIINSPNVLTNLPAQ